MDTHADARASTASTTRSIYQEEEEEASWRHRHCFSRSKLHQSFPSSKGDKTMKNPDVTSKQSAQVSPDSASETSSEEDDQHSCSNATTAFLKSTDAVSSTITSSLVSYSMFLVWPLFLSVPLLLSSPSSPFHYSIVFPSAWYEYQPQEQESRPQPLGLSLGILAVAVGQIWVWILFYLYKYASHPRSIQTKGARPYDFAEGLQTHVAQPEGFGLLIGYLAITWMCHLLPRSYYSFEGTIKWKEAVLCLIVQDGIQFAMHLSEHLVSPVFYQLSHKPHHRFTNPRLFDAFNGSVLDTVCMIILPLFLTAHIVRTANVWTYMTFGSSYASWLTLIHSEYVFPWDTTFRWLGLGTPADHHVHHKFFKYNYGHLFMWLDKLCGTYRDPQLFAPKVFRDNV